MTVRSRFAPSPTGFLHIGSVRTALYAWLFARHHGGRFVLRIEDTDRERSTHAAVDAILEGMAWVGLDADEGPIFQTQRFDRYREVAAQLLARARPITATARARSSTRCASRTGRGAQATLRRPLSRRFATACRT